jgi:hypothetical protein
LNPVLTFYSLVHHDPNRRSIGQVKIAWAYDSGGNVIATEKPGYVYNAAWNTSK